MAALRVCSVIAFTLAGSLTYADPAVDKARAIELSREADQAYKAGEFEKASELVRRAYELYPEPILLYNLALALDGMGASEQALSYYEKYLATNPDVKDRGAIERRVATMRNLLAAQAKERNPTTVQQAAPTRRAPVSKLPYLAIGTGVAIAGAGFGFGFASARRHDDAETASSQIAAQALQNRAGLYATTANILFIAGGACVLGGAIWALLDYRDRHDADDAHATLVVGPSYVGIAWARP